MSQPFAKALNPFLDALIQGDSDTCSHITTQALTAATPIPTLYQALFQPALYRVGELWAANRISVATEHMATAITEGLMNQIYPRLINPHRCGRKVVLATVEEELHQVGVKMAADVFEMQGWDTVLADIDCTSEDLLALSAQEQPDLLGLSFSLFFHLDTLERMLTRLRAAYPDLPILVGGQGLNLGGGEMEKAFTKVTCVYNLEVLAQIITTMGSLGGSKQVNG